jgi:hypothetical protein
MGMDEWDFAGFLSSSISELIGNWGKCVVKTSICIYNSL